MKISCNIFVGNRQFSTLSFNKPRKYVKSTLALCKHPKSGEFCIILFTNQDKNGAKYNIRGNIKQILTKFVNEGKCTIQFLNPEHDLFVTCEVIQLKGFLHLFKRVLENKVSDKELTVSSIGIMPIKPKQIAPIKLVITKRSEYPIKGFPRTLEELYINDIGRCGLDKGIMQLTKLKILNLSNNCIESIPDDLSCLQNLKELNLSHNLLGRGNKHWNWIGGYLIKTLVALDVSYNELNFIPTQICKLHNLISLNLNNNNLSLLPIAIGNLRSLKSFSATNNHLKLLPGSIKKLRLHSIDVSNNSFQQCSPNRPMTPTKLLPVCTLKEYASRKVISARLPYSLGSLPLTLISYLDNGKLCVCGKACFEVFLRNSHNLILSNIAENVSRSIDDVMYVPIDCYFCSLKCFNIAFQSRNRNRIVR